MRRNPDFILRYICGTPYLLVTGKEAAFLRQEIALNSTGAEIWNLLDSEMTEDEFIKKCCAYFECENEEETTFISEKVKSFSEQMVRVHAFITYSMTDYDKNTREFDIPEYEFKDQHNEGYAGTYKIVDIGLEVYGKKSYLPDNLELFKGELDGVKAVQKVVVRCCDGIITPSFFPDRFKMEDMFFLCSDGMCVYKAQAGYVAFLNKHTYVRWLYFSRDGKYVEIGYYEGDEETIKYEIYEATRFAFLYMAQLCGYAVLHSASIINNGKAVLFSAMSGVGKSTHAAIWTKLYKSEVFNGDVNLISFENGKPYINGLPWCGTSETYNKGKYEISSIVMLKQAEKNEIREFNEQEKTTHVLHRFITPNWTVDNLDKLLDAAVKVAKTTDVFQLKCNMEDEAAIMCKARVENHI